MYYHIKYTVFPQTFLHSAKVFHKSYSFAHSSFFAFSTLSLTVRKQRWYTFSRVFPRVENSEKLLCAKEQKLWKTLAPWRKTCGKTVKNMWILKYFLCFYVVFNTSKNGENPCHVWIFWVLHKVFHNLWKTFSTGGKVFALFFAEKKSLQKKRARLFP